MKKILLSLFSTLVLCTAAKASVSLGIDAGILADSSGNAITNGSNGSGSLVLLIASQGDSLFQAATVGSYTSGDDIVVGAFQMNYFGGTGEINTTATFSYTTVGSASSSTFDAGDLLAIRWFPNITFSQFQGGTKPAAGDFYGTYSSVGTPDGGIAWTAPADGASLAVTQGLNFYTTNSGGGGSQTPSKGYASTQVAAVPEPSTFALLGLGVGVAGWMARRNKKA